MKLHYNKTDKLKQKQIIDALFRSGLSVNAYPLRLVFNNQSEYNKGGFKIAVSVSKRFFKKAVDRNKIKRLLRESYRLQKQEIVMRIEPFCKEGLIGMIIYTGDQIPNFSTIESSMNKLWLKLESKLKKLEE